MTPGAWRTSGRLPRPLDATTDRTAEGWRVTLAVSGDVVQLEKELVVVEEVTLSVDEREDQYPAHVLLERGDLAAELGGEPARTVGRPSDGPETP